MLPPSSSPVEGTVPPPPRQGRETNRSIEEATTVAAPGQRSDSQAPSLTSLTLSEERWELLHRLEALLDAPMIVLAFVWLALFVYELLWGLNPFLATAGYFIWGLFILDFVLGFTLAPSKLDYLKSNWLKTIALMAPALRVFRIFRVFRAARVARAASAARGLRLVRVVSALNRGMRAFGESMSRRGFGYVAGLTLLVTLVGAAGMFNFENEKLHGLNSYGEALWWTAMIMTTMGSQYWPQSPEGRVLCFLLSAYALAILGYVAATLATFFIGRDAENDKAEPAGAKQLAALREDITALRVELRLLLRDRNQ